MHCVTDKAACRKAAADSFHLLTGTTEPDAALAGKPQAKRKSSGRKVAKTKIVGPCCNPNCRATGDRFHHHL